MTLHSIYSYFSATNSNLYLHFSSFPSRTFRNILATTSSSTMAVRCEFLKHCPFLEPLTNKQISRLAGALEISYYEKGEFILRQGENGDSFFIIEEGTVKCTQVKSSGREFELM